MIKPMMTWEASQRRWRKIYKGKLYVISCRQLGAPETKVESYQAANAWWVKKRAEIDGQRPPHPYDHVIREMEKRRDWLISHGLNPDAYVTWMQEVESWKAEKADPLHPSIVAELVRPSQEVWDDRVRRDQPESLPQARTVGTQVDRFLDLLMSRVNAKNLSVAEYDSARSCLGVFRDWLGSHSLVDTITPESWERWYKHLLDSKISIPYKRHRLRHSRTFVTWLAGKGLIVPPLNLHSRLFRFGNGHDKEVIPLSPQEVRGLIDKAKGVLKLHLLLMANCGMTQRDISDLTPEEIDWEEGRIDRRRSKTRGIKTPFVCWKLWSETLELLHKYAHREGVHALLTESGRTWMRDEIKNGKRSKTDSIKSLYVNAGLAGTPLKRLRSTGATMIKDKFGAETSDHWLGHGPKNVSDRSYWAKNQAKLDEAVAWLGQQYGF
jgi:integrase